MKSRLSHIVLRAVLLLLAAMPAAARACDQCMGGKDANIRPAINGAIFVMLGFVALMATGAGLFIRYLAKRSQTPLEPHVQLMMSMTEGTKHV